MSLKQIFQKQYQSTYAIHQAEIDSGDFDEIWNELVDFAICQINIDDSGQIDPKTLEEIEDFIAKDETTMATAVDEALRQLHDESLDEE